MILNIESSDAYPDIMRFYQQVYRVLRNGVPFFMQICIPVNNLKKTLKNSKDGF